MDQRCRIRIKQSIPNIFCFWHANCETGQRLRMRTSLSNSLHEAVESFLVWERGMRQFIWRFYLCVVFRLLVWPLTIILSDPRKEPLILHLSTKQIENGKWRPLNFEGYCTHTQNVQVRCEYYVVKQKKEQLATNFCPLCGLSGCWRAPKTVTVKSHKNYQKIGCLEVKNGSQSRQGQTSIFQIWDPWSILDRRLQDSVLTKSPVHMNCLTKAALAAYLVRYV